nr:class I SAM-dependent methyltransferase [Limobrevibacterium gyesilva]
MARSAALAQRLSAMLPARPRLLDLGAGTGSLFRWLAPIIGRAQAWTFADADADLLARAFADTAAWAEANGFTVTAAGVAGSRALLIDTPSGAWRVDAVIADLAGAPETMPLAHTDAVVCSALLDLVSAAWIGRFVAALRTPLLACLSVDGRDAFRPAHKLDRVVSSGFRRDQGRDKGFGPALGPRAPAVLHEALAAHGFAVSSAASDWCIPPTAAAMLSALVDGHARVAAAHLPGRRSDIAAWEQVRLRQAAMARLAIRIGHRDILALPPAG